MRPKTIEAMMRQLRDRRPNDALLDLYFQRARINSSDFQRTIAAFKDVAKKRQDQLTRKIQSFADLYWLPPAEPIRLVDEFKWAELLLEPIAKTLSAHANRVTRMQRAIDAGDMAEVIREATDSIKSNGWSYWAASVKVAAAYTQEDSAEATAIVTELKRIGARRVSGLLARMISDRNDPNISFNSFEAQCNDFLDREVDANRRALVKARALGRLDDEDQCARVLACDATSSYIDYYETLLQAAAVATDDHDGHLPNVVHAWAHAMRGAGIVDKRLDRIALTENLPHLVVEGRSFTTPGEIILRRAVALGTSPPPCSLPWATQVHARISAIDDLGLAAGEELDELLKAGVNFQSLPIGRALWLKAIQPFMPFDTLPLFMGSIVLGLEEPTGTSLLARSDSFIEAALRTMNTPRTTYIIDVLDGVFAPHEFEQPDEYDIWLSRALIARNQPAEALKIASRLRSFGGVWDRYGAKLQILAYHALHETERALRCCVDRISKDSRLAYELPLEATLSGESWRTLSAFPPWLTAYVSHFANLVIPSSRNRFICRMACRELYGLMKRLSADAYIDQQPKEDRKHLCDFLRIGWTDDNLSLVEDVASSQDLRREKLGMYQLLLPIDQEQADFYRGVIQTLTLDETLWAGLREIDSNRVFVNEPAITRWADKELSGEFDRWKALRSTEGVADLRLDHILRSYLVDHDIDALLRALPDRMQSEATAVMLGIITKLFARFLSDPANGLNSYLSLRVRHGTLRGVLLGPVEEERLLLSGQYSEEEFDKRWGSFLEISPEMKEQLQKQLRAFGERLDGFVGWIVNEKIQIRSPAKPEGMFTSGIDPHNAAAVFGAADPTLSFNFFLQNCYAAFWEALASSRNEISAFFVGKVAQTLNTEFDNLIAHLSETYEPERIRPLVLALQSLSTRINESCKVVATWFLPVAPGEEQRYPVSAALEIARKATANVYRDFHSELNIVKKGNADVGLSTSGLSVLYDSLFVIFGNAWVHSGLAERLGSLRVEFDFIETHQVLHLRVENSLSDLRLAELREGELDRLRARYSSDVPLDLVPVEGGSGFAKLARIAMAVDRNAFPQPLTLGVTDNDVFYVELFIQLYRREGLFDAYL